MADRDTGTPDPWDQPDNSSDAEAPLSGEWLADEPSSESAESGSDAGTYTLQVPEPQSPGPVTFTSLSETAPPDVLQGSPAPAARHRRRRRKRKRHDRTHPRPVPTLPLRSALTYPLTGAGPAVLAVYAVGMGLSRLLPVVGPLLALVVLTYLGMLLLETANDTLEDVPGGTRFPGIDLADLQVGLFGLTVMLIGMLPYVVGRSILGRVGGESPVWELLLWPLPLYYLPLAYVVLADRQNERGLDPRLVFRAMAQIGGLYFILVTLAASAFLVPAVTLSLLHVPRLVLESVNSFVLLYLMVALLRAAGLLYLRQGIPVEAPEPDRNEQAATGESGKDDDHQK